MENRRTIDISEFSRPDGYISHRKESAVNGHLETNGTAQHSTAQHSTVNRGREWKGMSWSKKTLEQQWKENDRQKLEPKWKRERKIMREEAMDDQRMKK
jgi:hypothetical protein